MTSREVARERPDATAWVISGLTRSVHAVRTNPGLGRYDYRPWSVDELIRDIGADLATRDALSNLQRLSLIHRCCDLAFPTRAALHAERLRQ